MPEKLNKIEHFSDVSGGSELDPQKEMAALLLAQAELTQDEVAAQVGVVRSTLWAWRQEPKFAACVVQEAKKITGRSSANRCLCSRKQD